MTDSKKSYYAVIPANIRYDESLPPNAKLLYGEITALCNAEGYCWASNKYFAELYEVSQFTISRWINALVNRGYIASQIIYKEGTKQIDKRYIQIHQYPIDGKINTYCQKEQYPIDEISNTPIDEISKENNTSLNTTSNNKKKESKSGSFDGIIEAYLSDGESWRFTDCAERKELLQEWLKVRKAKRAAMTDKAIQLNLDKLDALASKSNMTVCEYLKEVICRGWQAFYEIKSYDTNAKTPKRSNTDEALDFYELGKQREGGLPI